MELNIPLTAKRLKMDVGLSYNAPYSELWLQLSNDVYVIGVEPNPYNRRCIQDSINLFPNNSNRLQLNPKFFSRFTCMPYALDLFDSQETDAVCLKPFYCTLDDPGCSSLYMPVAYTAKQEYVPCIQLCTLMAKIPWDIFPYLEHLKIDAQGNDFRIIQSAGNYIEKILYITVECADERHQYNCNKEGSGHCAATVKAYLEAYGFKITTTNLWQITGGQAKYQKKDYHDYNLTFINTKLSADDVPCDLLQEG